MPGPADSLTPGALRVFRRLQALPAMKSFVLVGGSALALRVQHRKSEDLDFLFTGPRLPGPAIREITAALVACTIRNRSYITRYDETPRDYYSDRKKST